MIVLGIDPALTSLGWGVIDSNKGQIYHIASGIIKTLSSELLHKRLHRIAVDLNKIIDVHKPDIVAMEETFINMNAVSSMKLCYARGVVMSLVGSYPEITFQEFKPNLIKKTVVGAGRADKQQIVHMMRLLLRLDQAALGQFDQADALAVAYTSIIFSSNKFNMTDEKS